MIALNFAGALSRCFSVESPGITYPSNSNAPPPPPSRPTLDVCTQLHRLRREGRWKKNRKKERKLNFEKTKEKKKKKKSDAALLSCRSAAQPPQDFLM
jgi:hypothetical protein